MDYRTLELTLISAQGLKRASLFGKSDVYAVVYFPSPAGYQMLRTPVDKYGDSNPTWNFPMKFTFDFAPILQKRLPIIVEIYAVGIFSDKKLGKVRIPFVEKTLPPGVPKTKGHKPMCCKVITPSRKHKGYLSFSYLETIIGNSEETVAGYPPGMVVGPCSTCAAKGQSAYPPLPRPTYGGSSPAGEQPVNAFEAGWLGGAMAALLIAGAANGGGCGGAGCGVGGCGSCHGGGF